MFRGPAHFYEDQDAINLGLKRRETTRADIGQTKEQKKQQRVSLQLADRQFIGTFSKLVLAACHVMRVGGKDFYSNSRLIHPVMARAIVCWMAHTQFHRSYSNIGTRIGRDHSTVIHAVRQVNENWTRYDPLVQRVAEIIGHEFKAGEVPVQ